MLHFTRNDILKRSFMEELLLFFALLSFSIGAEEVQFSNKTCTISSIFSPTKEDYQLLQQFLHDTLEERIQHCVDPPRRQKIGRFKLYDPKIGTEPCSTIYTFGNAVAQDVVITYASHSEEFLGKLERLKRHLQKIGFTGHLLCYIGGWPNLSQGCLRHCMVPYATYEVPYDNRESTDTQ